MKSTATLSPCGLYRYTLRRTWDDQLDPLIFVMLNPSTADASKDDPTIRRCVGYAKREGCGGILVLNLMAYRATHPNDLLKLADVDPVGPMSHLMLATHLESADRVVVAWGAHRSANLPGAARSIELIKGVCAGRMVCLGTSKSGAPYHPLMQPAAAPLIPWPPG